MSGPPFPHRMAALCLVFRLPLLVGRVSACEFLQAEGHHQPGLTALLRDDHIADRGGAHRSGGMPDHLGIVRPGVVDVVGQRKHLPKRCLHVGHVGIVPRAIGQPVLRLRRDHGVQIVGVVDGVALLLCPCSSSPSLPALCCRASAS